MSDDDDINQQAFVAAAWAKVEEEERKWTQQVQATSSRDENAESAVTKTAEGPIVVIGGSGLLESALFSQCRVTLSGGIKLQTQDNVVFVSRHTASASEAYWQPHRIDHRAIWQAISSLKPSIVLAVCSVGSLQPSLIPLGSILCPTDWLQASFSPVSFHDDAKAHVKPVLDERSRRRVLDALMSETSLAPYIVNIPDRDLVYCQTRGPRFETKAEIRMIRTFADVVGMTAGDEATLACELGIPYVMLCFVDNIAHGLSADGDKNISSIEAFRKAQKSNLDRVEHATGIVIEALKGVNPLYRSPSPFAVDLLIHARYLHTVDASDRVIKHGVLAVRDGVIVGVHAEGIDVIPPYHARQVHHYPDSMLMPGLINAHTHSAMALMRGFGDDLRLTDWLVTKIWPAEAKCVSPEYVRDGTRLAFEEMLASGTTTCQDLYFLPDVVEEVAHEIGLRCVVGLCVIEFPSAMAKDGDDYVRLMRERLQRYDAESNKDTRLVTLAVCPHAPYSVSEEHIIEAKALATQHGCVFHTHLHECAEEIEASVKLDKSSGFCHRCDVACRPLANLDRIGVLDSSCSFAHMTQMEDHELDLIAERGCHVVHCPASNMKLASGFCPVAKMLEKGINVALGTDGAASNNSLDMVSEMRLAALLGKGVAKSPVAVNARQAVRMATINGARALGLEERCGSLEVGKRADLLVMDLNNRNECRPVYDPISSLVYSASRQCVNSVWVDGHAKVLNGARVKPLLTESEMRECAERWQTRMEDVVRELEEQ